MRSVEIICLVAVCALPATTARAAVATLAPDRMMVVDGERMFIIGLYEDPADDATLDAAAKAGFNLIHASANAGALDRLHARNVWAWLNTGGSIDLSEDASAREGQLKNLVAEFGQHPALLVWEVPDEALWNCFYSAYMWRCNQEPAQLKPMIDELTDTALQTELRGMMADAKKLWDTGFYVRAEETADTIWRKLGQESPRPGLNMSTAPERAAKMSDGMLAGYTLLRQLDSAHPVWMNHAPRNQLNQLASFNRAADIVGCDIYPVPTFRNGHSDLMESTVAAVGAYTERMQAAAPGKPVWMVLQGFGWRDLRDTPPSDPYEGRRPRLDETRFMAYDAIVHGARGILYWGSAYIEKDSELWQDLLTVIAELNELQPVLSAPDAPVSCSIQLADTYGSVDRDICILPKDVAGKVWLLVVNDWPEPLTYTITGLNGLNGVRYVENYSGNEAVVKDGALTMTITGHGVHVLAPQ
ncbi:MAG TPA: hypothetical protein PLD73_14275 [Candidatus Hydrogenedentes bacterium]|nr:hypothetical protein [Candidatus Hydrogenedentota bacterium]